jgi:hypothetical protein
MKPFVILLYFLILVQTVSSRGTWARSLETPGTSENRATGNRSFVFYHYAHHNERVPEVYPDHPLGEAVAKKLAMVEQLFVHREQQVVGYSDTRVSIVKPTVFNALKKIDSYYRRQARKGNIQVEVAASTLINLLDLGKIVYYSDDSKDFESYLRTLKSPLELESAFRMIVVKSY